MKYVFMRLKVNAHEITHILQHLKNSLHNWHIIRIILRKTRPL